MDTAVQRAALSTDQKEGRLWFRRYVRTAIAGDLACVFAGLTTVVVIRSFTGQLTPIEIGLAGVLVASWPVVIAAAGGYDERYLGDAPDEYRRVFQAAAALASLVAIIAYGTQTPIARGYVMAGLPWPPWPTCSSATGCASGCTSAVTRASACAASWSSVTGRPSSSSTAS
ncbi:hypothetical protein [Nonomuraea recticatena]|uniref:hypothetical protein n=1 Tax=Nonomuraea recticatena TaxID=46178 RepID=UPI00360C9183